MGRVFYGDCGTDQQIPAGPVEIGVGSRNLAVDDGQVEAGGALVQRNLVDVADGGEAREIIGPGDVEPQDQGHDHADQNAERCQPQIPQTYRLVITHKRDTRKKIAWGDFGYRDAASVGIHSNFR